MIVVSGGAGLIGSNLVKGLNDRGCTDIIVVDDLTRADKVKNLAGLQIADYIDKDEFYAAITGASNPAGKGLSDVTAILHEGACSDTMATDGRYVLHNNFTYTKALYHYCCASDIQLIYASSASVYGAGSVFIEQPQYESTLNAYAYSKLLFDNYLRRQPKTGSQCVGLRYFNVYGPREQHKGRMASVAWHFYNQFNADGKVKLFEGTDGYGNGEQRRDFVSVEDVVKVNLYLLDNPSISGIYNVGTGNCQSFNDVAVSVLNTLNPATDYDTASAVKAGKLEYIPMPEALKGKYQSFTEANLDSLRSTGYSEPFLTVQQGVERYISFLREGA